MIVRADLVQFERLEADLVARFHSKRQVLVVANFSVPNWNIYASASNTPDGHLRVER